MLEWKRPEKWGKHRKIKDPQEGGVVIVIGDINKRNLKMLRRRASMPGN
jgi:hypothetical protein